MTKEWQKLADSKGCEQVKSLSKLEEILGPSTLSFRFIESKGRWSGSFAQSRVYCVCVLYTDMYKSWINMKSNSGYIRACIKSCSTISFALRVWKEQRMTS